MTQQKFPGKVTAVNAATTSSDATVDVLCNGGTLPGLRYPQWYTPGINDVVVIDWLGSQPYVATAF